MAGSAKTKKSKRPPIKPKCEIKDCEVDSEELIECFECKSNFHLECINFAPVLYKLLAENKDSGLSWLWRCNCCTTPGDYMNQNLITNEVNGLITTKFNELKNYIDESIGQLVTNKVDEIKTIFEKDQQEKISPLISKENITATAVSVQTSLQCEETPNKPNDGEEIDQSHTREVKKQTCKYYKQGKCRHGANGKKTIEGRECIFEHPRKCLKYCKYGTDEYRGCSGPCNLLHPVLCKNSIQYRQCFRHECTFAHLQGTQRFKNEMPVGRNHSFNDNFNNRVSNFRDISGMNNISNAAVAHNASIPGMPMQNLLREGYIYNQHDFPKLRSAEDSSFSQLSNDIRKMMRDSIEYVLQTSRNDQQKNGLVQVQGAYNNNNISNLPIQPQFGDAKNCQRQNQFYPEQNHHQ